jgi:competence protein ComEA
MRPRTLLLSLAILLVLSAASADAAASGVVNVNSASSEQLQLLPSVGPALAGRILEFREANGPFASVEELVAVKGIGEKSLDRLRPYVTTKGETTLSEKVRIPRSKPEAAAS